MNQVHTPSVRPGLVPARTVVRPRTAYDLFQGSARYDAGLIDRDFDLRIPGDTGIRIVQIFFGD